MFPFNEEPRARAANLERLDELLATLSDTNDHQELLTRVSSMARKVLRHAALIELPTTPGGSDWDS